MHSHRLGRRLTLRAGGLTLAAGLALTGCGWSDDAAERAGGDEPAVSGKDAVSQAFAALGQATTARFTLKIDGDPAELAALDPDATAADQQTIEQVLAGDVQLAVTAPEDKTLGQVAAEQDQDVLGQLRDPARAEAALEAAGSFSMSVNLGGSELVGLAFAGTTLYARADVTRVAELAGEDTAELEAMAGQLPSALAPLAKGLEGEWVGVDLVEALQAADSLGVLDQLDSMPMQTPDPAAAKNLTEALTALYDEDVTVTELEETDRGQAYRLTGNARELVGAIADELDSLSGGTTLDLQEELQDVPDQDYSAVVHVKDGALTGVSLDLAQFSEEQVDAAAALDLGVELDGEPVTAPADANLIDVSQALLSLGGLMGRPS